MIGTEALRERLRATRTLSPLSRQTRYKSAVELPPFMSNPAHIFMPVNMKQRRPERSCDICRRRKIKCDGPTMPNRNCSNCVAFGSPCTYVEPSRKRGPKNPTVEELKHEIAALKSKLRTLSVCSLCAQPLHSQGASTNASVFQQRSPESDITTVEELPPEDNDVAEELAVRFRQFSVTTMEKKYFGSAGSFALVNNAMAMKEQYTGRPMIVHTRRSLYWDILPWEKEHYDKRAHYTYPDGDLIASLLELYFTVVHPTLPILHRPLFEKSVAEGLHLTNMEFGGLLLSVLALASRYSDDPRVLIEGNSLSAGWKFAKQLEMVRKMFEPSIHETQMYCLMALYSLGTSLPQISWVYLGLGIRFLQQRGKHRRKRDSTNLSVEDELWKKTFWSFMCVDTMMCTFLGRPMGLHGEDYDVNPPLQIDDEYWDCGFTQPPGEPPLISYFICDSRLCEILGDTLRRLYGSRKAKLLMGWNGPQWEQRTVSELNSAMNDFLDTIPSHLRWDPESPPQGVFFDQSASLYITYQYILITIHRPYFHKVPDASMPSSLSICTRAARAIVHTADIWLNKLQRLPPPNMLNPVFVSGVVLSLNIFATKRAGLHPKKDLAQVERAMEILKFAQHRWQAAGRLGELLGGLLSLDGLFPLKNLPSDTDELQPAKPRQSTFTMSGVSPSSTSVHDKPDGQPIPEHLWSGPLSSDHFGPAPGVSIEQLLADTEPLDSMNIVLDDELLSMWMAAPIDISNTGSWDAYYTNINGTNIGALG